MSLDDKAPLIGKIQFMKVVAPIMDEKEVQEQLGYIEQGNIPAMITIIMHNQAVISNEIKHLYEGGVRGGGAPSGGKAGRKTS